MKTATSDKRYWHDPATGERIIVKKAEVKCADGSIMLHPEVGKVDGPVFVLPQDWERMEKVEDEPTGPLASCDIENMNRGFYEDEPSWKKEARARVVEMPDGKLSIDTRSADDHLKKAQSDIFNHTKRITELEANYHALRMEYDHLEDITKTLGARIGRLWEALKNIGDTTGQFFVSLDESIRERK